MSSNLPQPELTATGTVLDVADVERLYREVNDPANEGAAIILAPGTYVLSVADGGGVARPNAGRLELQRDMSLYGVTGDPSAVVIDATGLPETSWTMPPPLDRTAPVRVGRGNTTIEWLTIVGPPGATAGISTDLEGTPSTRIRVAHVVSRGTSRGVDVRNRGAGQAGRRIDAEIRDNEFIGPAQVGVTNNGIRLVNFIGADGAIIVASLSGNRIQGYQMGCVVANNRASNATVHVRSSGDRFFANGLGAAIIGGLGRAPTGANANSTSFEAHGTAFVDNAASIGGVGPGGIRVIGGGSASGANVASNNTVSVALWGAKVSGNSGVNFEVFGAFSEETPPRIAGQHNHVKIELHGVSKKLKVTSPVEPDATNTVTVDQ